MLKEGDEFTALDIQKNVRTFISHNKGGKWELLKAPAEDFYGNKLNCFLEEGCSLNLQIYSSNGMYPPPYSQDSAVGLVMAVGNVGEELERHRKERINTYLSRDGGLTFNEVRKGSYIYEFGDHGGLIVMARHQEETKEIIYSFNEGKTWHELEISSTPVTVTNIIIEPYSISQQFVVYGTYQPADAPEPKGIVVTVDFANLHEPKCKGADKPGDDNSDYELWTPFDGRHGEKCFMGQQITYVRRKQDAECYNGEELERKILRSYCPCNDMDYECDLGYERNAQGTCVLIEDAAVKTEGLNADQLSMCESFGYYTVTQGYRKVPGNKC